MQETVSPACGVEVDDREKEAEEEWSENVNTKK